MSQISYRRHRFPAEIAGITDDQLRKWVRGDAWASFPAMVALCKAAGRSLDWLATGQGPMAAPTAGELPSQVDEGLLRDVIEAVEENLAGRGVSLPPAKKALLIADLYMTFLNEVVGETAREDLVMRLTRLAG